MRSTTKAPHPCSRRAQSRVHNHDAATHRLATSGYGFEWLRCQVDMRGRVDVRDHKRVSPSPAGVKAASRGPRARTSASPLLPLAGARGRGMRVVTAQLTCLTCRTCRTHPPPLQPLLAFARAFPSHIGDTEFMVRKARHHKQ
jgi:hypothetical protein